MIEGLIRSGKCHLECQHHPGPLLFINMKQQDANTETLTVAKVVSSGFFTVEHSLIGTLGLCRGYCCPLSIRTDTQISYRCTIMLGGYNVTPKKC